MAIQFSCAKCGKSFSVRDENSGKRAKCSCGHILRVPKIDPPQESFEDNKPSESSFPPEGPGSNQAKSSETFRSINRAYDETGYGWLVKSLACTLCIAAFICGMVWALRRSQAAIELKAWYTTYEIKRPTGSYFDFEGFQTFKAEPDEDQQDPKKVILCVDLMMPVRLIEEETMADKNEGVSFVSPFLKAEDFVVEIDGINLDNS